MLCPPPRIVSLTTSGPAASGGASAIAEQGSAVPGARAPSRLGTGALGRIVSRAGIQTQCMADAMPGRVAPALVGPPDRGTASPSPLAGHQRFVAAGSHACSSRNRRILATRLGPVVARTRRVLGLHSATRTVALSRLAPRQSSPAPTGTGLSLV